MIPRASAFGLVLLLAVAASGCAVWRGPGARVEPARLSDAMDDGDAARRASQRLVLEGLIDDESGSPDRALGHYSRAIQVDPTNPWALLALARHQLDAGDPESALDYVDQARARFELQGALSPRVDVHLVGLEGAAWQSIGDLPRGEPLLDEAAALAPDVWSDGHLAPEELR